MPEFRLGLDLGQRQDFSAAIAVERVVRKVQQVPVSVGPYYDETDEYDVYRKTGHRFNGRREEWEDVFFVRLIEKWPLRTRFTSILDDVGLMLAAPEFRGEIVLYYDRTGIGGPIAEEINDRYRRGVLGGYWPVGVTMTAGSGGSTFSRSKTDLVHSITRLVTSERLVVGRDVPGAADLQKELEAFAPKLTPTGQIGYEAKEGHDDLVMALALAVHSPRKHGVPRQLVVDEDGDHHLVIDES